MKQNILEKLSAACPWRDTLHWYDTIDSTNTQAKRLAEDGAANGTVLIAGQQTHGRGRLGRSFHSPQGKGLYLSLILRPQCPPEQLMHLTCCAAVATCEAVAQTSGILPGIKWINDMVIGKRKLGGILTELSVNPKTGLTDYAIIGIGLNCNHRQEDFPASLQEMATSLYLETGRTQDPATLAAALIDQLHSMAQTLLSHRSQYMAQYRDACITIGKQIVAVRADEKRYGTAMAVLDDGSLLVALSDGTQEAVSSGEVSIRGMYGYV